MRNTIRTMTVATLMLLGPGFATLPAAQADSANVQNQCPGLGGDWPKIETGGSTYYSCCYKPLAGAGERTCDYYTAEGTFLGSDATNGKTKPHPRPAPPGIMPPPGSNAGRLP